jgi:hypothetical protein
MPKPGAVRVLLFSASLRTDSLNTRLARLARSVLGEAGVTVDWATMHEFDAPSYKQDVETGSGFPPGAVELYGRLPACDRPDASHLRGVPRRPGQKPRQRRPGTYKSMDLYVRHSQLPGYSARSATTGSTSEARRAGR